MNKKSGQTLILILILVLVSTALGSAVSRMQTSDMEKRIAENDGILAFYLAQAALERAKAELANNWAWTGIPLASPIQLDSRRSYYALVNEIGGGDKEVVGVGIAGNSQKQISLQLRPDMRAVNLCGTVAGAWRER
jgi:type II secretory pathway component PulK